VGLSISIRGVLFDRSDLLRWVSARVKAAV